jgi:hypothetical protein
LTVRLYLEEWLIDRVPLVRWWRLRPRRRLRQLAQWARSFEGCFPEEDDRDLAPHWHYPVAMDPLMDGPDADPALQAKALQFLLDAAERLVRARPPHRRHQRVYVLMSWPDASDSQVGVFVDVEYGRTFEERDHPVQTWTPLDPSRRSLARELGLLIPAGFEEAGYHERMEDEDEDEPGGVRVTEREIWMIREPVPDGPRPGP